MRVQAKLHIFIRPSTHACSSVSVFKIMKAFSCLYLFCFVDLSIRCCMQQKRSSLFFFPSCSLLPFWRKMMMTMMSIIFLHPHSPPTHITLHYAFFMHTYNRTYNVFKKIFRDFYVATCCLDAGGDGVEYRLSAAGLDSEHNKDTYIPKLHNYTYHYKVG